MTKETKDTNPKDAIGATKLPMHLCPSTAMVEWSLAQLEGALKYGKFNWRVAGVRASIYLDAMKRHISKFENGRDRDPVTLVHELGSVMACCAIIIDASMCDKLTDDRPPRSPAPEAIDAAAERVKYLQQLFADHNPHQYTIEDSQWEPESSPTSTTASTTPPPKPKSSEPPATKPAVKRSAKGKSGKVTAKKSTTSSRSRKAGRTRNRTVGS